MNILPEAFSDLFADGSRTYAYLATINLDGTSQVTPVWFNMEGDHIKINTVKGRVKDRNMRRDPRVTILFQDPNSPYRYLQVKGNVVDITEEGGTDHINELAGKYTGTPYFPPNKPGEIRVIYLIKPIKAQGMG